MTKLKAFALHLVISSSIFSILLLVIYFLWYPSFFSDASGVWNALATLAFVDVGLGPLMTLVLYKKNKPGLKFDLSLVAAFQIVALFWGTWVLYSERPLLVAYHKGLMVCMNAQQVSTAEANIELFNLDNALLPQAILPMPTTAEEAQQRQHRLNADDEKTGLPVYLFGKDFVPVTAAILPEMLHWDMDVQPVVKTADLYQQRWTAFTQKYPSAEKDFAFFILACGGEDYFAAVDHNTGVIRDVLKLPFLNAEYKYRVKTK